MDKLPRNMGKAVNDSRWKKPSRRESLDLIAEYNKNNSWYDDNEWQHAYTEEMRNAMIKDTIEDVKSRLDPDSKEYKIMERF